MIPKLSIGNKKLGSLLNFNLPNHVTCPGKSKWCMQKCYALKAERLFPQCKFIYAHNLLATNEDTFVNFMIEQIKVKNPGYFRIHPSGDFYSVGYIHKWVQICKALPNVQFCAFTRSWNRPRLLQALEQLSSPDNVQLFYSTDPTMPKPSKGRIAFIDIDDRAEGVKCFAQLGIKKTCLTCGFCFKKSKSNIVFKVH